MLLQIYK